LFTDARKMLQNVTALARHHWGGRRRGAKNLRGKRETERKTERKAETDTDRQREAESEPEQTSG
jgi:hypothetical protein